MTRDDIIRMAREANAYAIEKLPYGKYQPDRPDVRDLHFAALVAAAEREACARVCERAAETIWRGHETAVIEAGTNVCNNVAAAIRARGEP